ncbi:cation:proton antiporter [Nocardioides alkalitolerans]|uniref:cation:proton antiporter n=1 Tax=Nocardioides alkalitolerans TaxID=281714 RepID=UPI00040BBF0A|nr:sodium:proton antiporter [Nocardioides alkalitolerans]
MEQTLALVVLAVLAIAGASVLGGRIRVASPLLLVAVGIGVSLLPFVPAFEVEPEWILTGVLPPLLYSASVSMPAMDFRREFSAIGGLSVVLVILSAVVLGLFFSAVIPDLPLAWGIALGAIVSPTDAVATSIVKRIGVSPRVVAILEGESLLNDATALVLLRAAVAAAATGWSLGGVLQDFVLAVGIAVVIGVAVGRANLWARARVADAPVNTAISLTVPFVAALPAEHLGASGLVAAVVAGLVTGRGAPRVLSPEHRLSDSQTWHTIEAVLEGAVFLVMGLELYGLLEDIRDDGHGASTTVLPAVAALALVLAVRAAYVAPLLALLQRRARRGVAVRPRVDSLQQKLADPEAFAAALTAVRARGGRLPRRWRGRPARRAVGAAARVARRATGRRQLRVTPEHLERFGVRVRRRLADIDYLVADPLGPREGVVVVWAGMRGAVTLAAAQTLPADAPDRSLLVFLAFLVATGSLLLQGGTLGAVVRYVGPATVDLEAQAAERAKLAEVLRATEARLRADAAGETLHPLDVIEAQRDVLLDLSREGAFSSASLRGAMAALDADQIRLELTGRPIGDE